MTAGKVSGYGPVLQNFGNMSGISHLLHAPMADPSRIAITTVQTFPIKAPPAGASVRASVQFDRPPPDRKQSFISAEACGGNRFMI
jgi:hypothetical protein